MSYASSHTYETLYLLRPGISESDANAIHQKVDNVIQKFSGKLRTRDDWGVKELAYTIEKERNARFCLAVYEGAGGVVEEIERHFRISDDVVRYLTVAMPTDYDYNKVKKQMHASEEEVMQNRESRMKKGL